MSHLDFIRVFRTRHEREEREASSFNKQNSCVRCCCGFDSFCINCSLSFYEIMHMTTLKNKCSVFCSADGLDNSDICVIYMHEGIESRFVETLNVILAIRKS